MALRTGKPIGDLAASLVSGMWQGFVTSNEFMPPGPPLLKPILPDVSQDKKFRAWDYPALFNAMAGSQGREPNADVQGLTFDEIRNFSEEWEIVRLVIETCKDQLSKLRWTWRLIPQENESAVQNKNRSLKDNRVKELNTFFKRPDKEHNFYQWLRTVLEELLVADTVVLYRRPTLVGGNYSINVVDCATIERKLDYAGLTPTPDNEYPFNIAYQQKIKGVILSEFTTEEMIYFTRNPRVNKVYGYSPIEQIIVTINTGINRMLMQLAHYTDGNIPAMFMKMPIEWTREEIKLFQIYWNELMSGNLGELSKGWAIPGDTDPVFPQKDTLKDDFDEWVSRIACYAYSVSPNAFIKNLNRATSEQSREQADEEGVQMRMFLVENVMNEILEKWWGYDDIEFNMVYDRPQDSLKQAQIDNIDIRVGVKSVDEVRGERGLVPIGAPARVYTSNGYIPLTEGDEPKFDIFIQENLTPPTDKTDPAQAANG